MSNVGSFGENVFKIGMTRRLDPRERVKELGDASVPFEFDVHAMIYSEDAPGLEGAMHRQFDSLRVNLVNLRKEFFEVELDKIVELAQSMGLKAEITKIAEAREFKETTARRTAAAVAIAPPPATRDHFPDQLPVL